MRNIIFRRPLVIIFVIVALIVAATALYHFYKPLPDGVSVEGEVHKTDDIEFLHDLTYQEDGERKKEQMIFDHVFDVIEDADEFVVLDMFLFNGQYDQSLDFPEISEELAQTLIDKKQEDPDVEMVVLTDRINTFYGSYETDILNNLEENGISVFYTNMNVLRDSNPLYSGVYRTFFQWFGTGGKGWLPNAFSPDAPDVTLRSYLELLNFKANHRKTVVTEDRGIVTSANPHDASAFHSNIGFEIQGEVLKDILDTESAIAEMAGAEKSLFSSMTVQSKEPAGGKYDLQLLTEGKIEKHLLQEMENAEEGDQITMGAFYLADRDVIDALSQASGRGVNIRLLLDANKDAFGREKNGIPNRPAARELAAAPGGNIDIRWYRTDGEQFHTKMVYLEKGQEDVVIGGSANYTKRNIGDFNLESNVKITTDPKTGIMSEVDQYFDRLWFNEGHRYTTDFETYNDDSVWSYLLYRLQEWSGVSSF